MDTQKEPDPKSWVDQHGDALFRYALLRVRDVDRAEDLVQETLLAALDARRRFADRSSERTWLIGILRHKIVDHYRRAGRERAALLDAAEEGEDEFFNRHGLWKGELRRWGWRPERVLEEREFWDVLHACLATLPPRLAEAFLLREIDEQSAEDVRQVLDISATNLWAMLHRARLRLRRCLDANWFGRTRPKK